MIQESIAGELDRLEHGHQALVLYACESGSRAWGFASPDSDFDVRFLYIRPVAWYLSLNEEKKRDTLEFTTPEGLDLVGWDLKKALLLMLKSNPSFLEWLRSPIVYRDRDGFQAKLQRLSDAAFSPRSCAFHYYRWALQNYRDYLVGETVSYKKYFYVLRPLLAVLWLERGYGPVPMEFQLMMARMITNTELRSALSELMQTKRQARELAEGPRMPVIHQFITAEFSRLAANENQRPDAAAPIEPLNEFFLSVVLDYNSRFPR